MKQIRRTFWALWCLALVAVVSAWLRTERTRDVFTRADRNGCVVGLATNPGEFFLFKNTDQSRDSRGILVPLGFAYYHDAIRTAAVSDRYSVSTHRIMSDGGGSGSLRSRRNRGIATTSNFQPTFATRWKAPGVRAQGGSFRAVNYEQIVVSFWLVACVVIPLPTIAAVRSMIRRKRLKLRLRQGRCLNCGFDLRASKNRCPECNHPIPTPTNPPPTPPPAEADSSS